MAATARGRGTRTRRTPLTSSYATISDRHRPGRARLSSRDRSAGRSHAAPGRAGRTAQRAVRIVAGEACVGHGTKRPASTISGTARGPVSARSRRLTRHLIVTRAVAVRGRGATTRRTARPSRAAASCADNRAAGQTRPCLSRARPASWPQRLIPPEARLTGRPRRSGGRRVVAPRPTPTLAGRPSGRRRTPTISDRHRPYYFGTTSFCPG